MLLILLDRGRTTDSAVWYDREDVTVHTDVEADRVPASVDLRHLEEIPTSICYVGYDMLRVAQNLYATYIERPAPPRMAYSAHVCAKCLSAYASYQQLTEHDPFCRIQGNQTVPGKVVYDDPFRGVRVKLIDGARHVQFCRNLAILGACFIRDKDLEVDVDVAEFYVATAVESFFDDTVPHRVGNDARTVDGSWDGYFVVGYFARIKQNQCHLATTILTLPMCNRRGLGSLMLSLAYHLSELRVEACGDARCCGALPGKLQEPFSDQGKSPVPTPGATAADLLRGN
jgi:hypothetical protein